jgi:hypothetical protein
MKSRLRTSHEVKRDILPVIRVGDTMASSRDAFIPSIMYHDQGLLLMRQGLFVQAVAHISLALDLARNAALRMTIDNSSADDGPTNPHEASRGVYCTVHHQNGHLADFPNPVSESPTVRGVVCPSFVDGAHQDVHAAAEGIGRIRTSDFEVEEEMSMYCRPFAISASCQTSFQSLSLLMMFNLALSFHMSAIQHVSNGARNLLYAARDFESARGVYEVIRTADARSLGSWEATFYTMVVCNNLCHVYQKLGNVLAARSCQEELLRIVLNCTAGRLNGQEILGPQLEGFIENAWRVFLTPPAAPAA